jgi:hypothetical protein
VAVRGKMSAEGVWEWGVGSNRDGGTGEWRKIHNELNDQYCSPNIERAIKSRTRLAGHVVRMGEGVYRVLVGKPEGKRPLGKPRRRWEDNIKIDVQELGCGCRNWIQLAQDRESWRAQCEFSNEYSEFHTMRGSS